MLCNINESYVPGAGKTYTITGPEVEDFDRRGLCMRAASFLFQQARRIKHSNITFKFSAVEIYNDFVVDLLREDQSKNSRLVVLETPTGVVLPSLFIVPLESEEEAFTRLIEANVNRYVEYFVVLVMFVQSCGRASVEPPLQSVACNIHLLHDTLQTRW